jgi:putative spermidine/putrescine transport system substrate-binding protein
MIAAGLSVATLGLAACGNSSTSSANAAPLPSTAKALTKAQGGNGYPASAKPVTITINTDLDDPIAGTNKRVYQDVWVPQFEKAYPNIHVKVIDSKDSSADQALYSRIIAAQHSHATPPVDITDSSILPQMIQQNAGVKITPADVPLLKEVDPTLLKATKYLAIPFRGSSVVLAYNSAFVKTPPTTLSGLLSWIRQHPGKFTYNTPSSGGSGEGFVQAIVNQNVPASKENTFATSYQPSLESYWEKGFKTLAALKPYIYHKGFYPDGNDATLQLLANSSIWMAPVWSDGASSSLAQHQLPSTVKLSQLNPPLPGGPADLMVVKGSKHQRAAFTFINYMLSAPEQALVADYMKGYPGVQWKYAPAAVRKEFGPIAKSYAPAWASQFTNDLSQKWQDNVAAG